MFSERFEMFRNEHSRGPVRPRRARRRNMTATFRVTLLRPYVERFTSSRGKTFAVLFIKLFVMLITNHMFAEFDNTFAHFCPVDAIATHRLVVQKEQSESQFAETLRSTFPQLQGREFELCRADAQRLVSPLCLQVKTPAAIIDSGQLGRSALYIKEKVN